LSAEFSESFLLELLHSLLFEFGFIFLGKFRLGYHDVAVDGCSAILDIRLIKVVYEDIFNGFLIYDA